MDTTPGKHAMYPHQNWEITPHTRGIILEFNIEEEPVLLNMADVYALSQEMDRQIALSAGLDLLTVTPSQMQSGDVLWDIGRIVSVSKVLRTVDSGGEEMFSVVTNMSDSFLYLPAHLRMRVGRVIE